MEKKEHNLLIFHFHGLGRILPTQEVLKKTKKQLIKQEWPIITVADAFP